jgi:flavin reductase
MIDGKQFKSGMRRLAAGVTVVTSIDNGAPHGLLATSTSSVCAEPVPSLLVCVNRQASCYEAIVRSRVFCANVLSLAHGEIAQRFGSRQHRDKRFEGCDWRPLTTGAPALTNALASFDCEVARLIQVHSHAIVIGEVKELRLWRKEIAPLLYFDGRYERLAATDMRGIVDAMRI